MVEVKRFFMFANRYKRRYGDLDNFLYNHPDYNDSSVFILFNRMLPVSFDSVKNFKRKWIYFRCLFGKDKVLTYMDLDLLKTIDFERFYSIPECSCDNHKDKEYCKVFFELIHQKDIDISKLFHSEIDNNEEHKLLFEQVNSAHKPWDRTRNLSSGLWTYVYLKTIFPKSKFTLIGFNADISPKNHEAIVEKEYLLQQVKQHDIELFCSFNIT